MQNISREVTVYPISSRSDITNFIESKTGRPYQRGTAFYQLSKPEKAVQDYKKIVIQNKYSGEVYSGDEARTLLGLPVGGTIRLSPGDHGAWNIYIQSTSSNRILFPGTSLLYWPDVR